MRIEAHGDFQSPKKETRPLKFCCTNCRCKFVADPGEYIEGKKNTNAIASKDPRPRTKIYVSVCPECNEVVLLPESCAHFVKDPLSPLDIFNRVSDRIKIVSKRPNIPSGIYKVVDCSIGDIYKDTKYNVEATFSLISNDDIPGRDPVLIHYDSNDSEGIELYDLDRE